MLRSHVVSPLDSALQVSEDSSSDSLAHSGLGGRSSNSGKLSPTTTEDLFPSCTESAWPKAATVTDSPS
jgi:hypothetical protein